MPEDQEKNVYVYFVSYVEVVGVREVLYGRAEIWRSVEVTGIKHVAEMEDALRHGKPRNLSITSYQFMRMDSPANHALLLKEEPNV